MNQLFKNAFVAAIVSVLLGTGLLMGAEIEQPSSVIHVVTVKWKDGTTPAQIKAALDGVANMDYPGIKRVWLKSFKSQTMDAAFIMEFESQKALEDYAGSKAQEEWYKLYIPIRERSVTSDVTN